MSDNVEGESSRTVYRVQLNLNIDRDRVSDISDIVYRVSDICSVDLYHTSLIAYQTAYSVYQIWSIAYQTSPQGSF